MEVQTITVSQLAKYLKQIFEAEELLFNISVVGEVSGLKLVRGILYFDLKDENALISCICFNGLDFDVKNGDKIIAKGTPNYYVKGGKLNFNVNKITPFGIGNLFQQYIKLKEKLEKEGLFDVFHKKQIPSGAKRVGVITSETGAVIRDIITVIKRRDSSVDIVLYPSKVQGEDMAKSVIEGLNFFENYNVDVVIIARGGGSFEDLFGFNDEALARRIYDYKKPVISAVGHETDFTICDFVADVRSATPSVAGELVVQNIENKKTLYEKQCSKLKSLIEILENQYESKLYSSFNNLTNMIDNFLNENKYYLSLQRAKLDKLNPDKILALGYARVEVGNNVITSSKELKLGDTFEINFKDGKIKGETK